ncbi:2-oxo-4-hydroxy-4-carboxy-5-ureidoimidazoline decarboxylase [Microbaculum marinum]|uniref:2-oxo-4-hydroxy-4-carboxy-5-ureidoimidazoline decarboxylase n=1 Tax=Microbaculum marinum TaxID=1764581 RepID=A0AAW9RW93_9HYPH
MTGGRMTMAEVNAMTSPQFADTFCGVAERSRWVAEAAAADRPYGSRADMVAAFADAVRHADRTKRLELLNAHPDLAGRAAIAGDIGPDSRTEQARAGLDRLTPEEFRRFTDLNARYRRQNGFPFILAVSGATKHDILDAFEGRIGNDAEAEFETAIDQVCRIIGFRLEARVE